MKNKIEAPKISLRARISRMLSFPIETLGGVSTVTLSGGSALMVEGCEGIIEYDGDVLKLRLRDGILTVQGRFIVPENFSTGLLSLSGAITALDFHR